MDVLGCEAVVAGGSAFWVVVDLAFEVVFDDVILGVEGHSFPPEEADRGRLTEEGAGRYCDYDSRDVVLTFECICG